MKFYETHFEEYIHSNDNLNLHPKLDKIFQKFPKTINNLKNLIFYGPQGTGKYTQMLKSIKKYSPSELKYEKKITINFNKLNFFFKLSDIHYEIDMSLLGCNSKILWHEIYQQIIDIISAKTEKSGIIVCKNFHEIHSELLDNFYSYMQQNTYHTLDLKYIIITQEISFIPDSILNCCEIININRPSKNMYNKCLKIKLESDFKVENISNIKNLYSLSVTNIDLMLNYKNICNKIINEMININELNFLKFRDLLYDIFIYNLDITHCIWFILYTIIKDDKIKPSHNSELMIKTYQFLHYYNNNYRPIYHLENYLFYIIKIIHVL
jgi:hypothetical protein